MCGSTTSTAAAELTHAYEHALVAIVQIAERALDRDADAMRAELAAIAAHGRAALTRPAVDHHHERSAALT